jgi:hypothetical protein
MLGTFNRADLAAEGSPSAESRHPIASACPELRTTMASNEDSLLVGRLARTPRAHARIGCNVETPTTQEP